MVLLEALKTGIVIGCVYALLAVAINIIYATTDIINFAHAELVMLGAMLSLSVILHSGIPLIPGLIISCILVGVVAVVLYYTTVKPFGDQLGQSIGWIITTMGASLIIGNAAMLIWGARNQAFPNLGGEGLKTVLGLKILPHDLWIIVITLTLALLLMVLLDKTLLGKAIKATANSHNATRLMGINVEKIILLCFFLSGVVAWIAGNLIAPITFAGPTMGTSIGLKGFGAAIIGGLGIGKGAFIGGLLLGITEAIFMLFLSAGYKDVISFVLIIAVLSVKPGGLFGGYNKKQI